jgi:hypothetical protein
MDINMKIPKRILEPDADQTDDDESISRDGAAVVHEVTDPKPRKRRIWSMALRIAFLLYIGIVGGYLYYNW